MSKRSALLHGDQRLPDELLVHLVREVLLQGAAVEHELAGAGHQAHPDDGLLAAADGLDRAVGDAAGTARDGVEALDLDLGVELGLDGLDDDLVLDGRSRARSAHGWSSRLAAGLVSAVTARPGVISNGTGCCAACGCSGPRRP